MIEVRLSWMSCIAAVTAGVGRELQAQQRFVGEQKRGSLPGWVYHIQGAGGEMAAHQHYDKFPDLVQSKSNKIVGLADLIVNSYKIDVKTPLKTGCDLTVYVPRREKDVDIYLLAEGSFPTFFLVGWAFAIDVVNGRYDSARNCHTIKRSDLLSPPEIRNLNATSSSKEVCTTEVPSK